MTFRRQTFDLFLDPRQADAVTEVEIRLGRIAYVKVRVQRDLDQVQCTVQHFQRGDSGGNIFGDALLDQLRATHAQSRPLGDSEHFAKHVEQLAHLAGVTQYPA